VRDNLQSSKMTYKSNFDLNIDSFNADNDLEKTQKLTNMGLSLGGSSMFNSKNFNVASEYNSNDRVMVGEPITPGILGNESILNLT